MIVRPIDRSRQGDEFIFYNREQLDLQWKLLREADQ